jgi:signal transduction histidine kinase/tetratricopeptide (TPR) repeat protein
MALQEISYIVPMKSVQWPLLLETAEEAYCRRDLATASVNAAEAILDAEAFEDPNAIFLCNVLLARIALANGNFSGKKTFFGDARERIVLLRQRTHVKHQPDTWFESGLLLAEICISQRDYDYAEALITELESLANTRLFSYWPIRLTLMRSKLLQERNVYAEALDLAFKAKIMAENEPDCPMPIQAEICEQLSQLYLKRQDAVRTIEHAVPLLEFSNILPDGEKKLTALNNIAVSYGMQGDLKTAMHYFLEAYDHANLVGSRSAVSNLLTNIGTIYAKLFNYKSALDRYQNAFRDYSDIISDHSRVVLLNNMGTVYIAMNQFDDALDAYEQALGLSRELGYRDMELHNLAQCARVYLMVSDIAAAQIATADAEALVTTNAYSSSGMPMHLLNQAALYAHRNALEQSVIYGLKSVLSASRAADDDTLLGAYNLLAQTYAQRGEYKKAYRSLQNHKSVKSRIADLQQHRLLLDLEIRYAIAEKQKTILSLQEQSRQQQKLIEQANQIETQNVKLQQMNEELRQFTYVVTHDLKEPLRMITSFTQLIERSLKDNIDVEIKKYMGFVTDGVHRLDSLLVDLMNFSMLGTDTVEKNTVIVHEVLEAVSRDLGVKINETGATLTWDAELPILFTSRTFFSQLVTNLINNAIKFHKPDESPSVHVRYYKMGDFHHFEVIDNGIGIPVTQYQRIFMMFQRLHRRNDYEGTGIGLAICQKITLLLGGTIGVRSVEGEGSTFYFTLPVD